MNPNPLWPQLLQPGQTLALFTLLLCYLFLQPQTTNVFGDAEGKNMLNHLFAQGNNCCVLFAISCSQTKMAPSISWQWQLTMNQETDPKDKY